MCKTQLLTFFRKEIQLCKVFWQQKKIKFQIMTTNKNWRMKLWKICTVLVTGQKDYLKMLVWAEIIFSLEEGGGGVFLPFLTYGSEHPYLQHASHKASTYFSPNYPLKAARPAEAALRDWDTRSLFGLVAMLMCGSVIFKRLIKKIFRIRL